MTSCIDKVEKVFESRMEEIRILWNAEDNETEELGSLNDYGLSIDFVEPGTFTGQKRGYYRYQLSWGGPSDEFRIYNDNHVEFWYLDWFDGASVRVTGEDASIIRWIIEPHMEYCETCGGKYWRKNKMNEKRVWNGVVKDGLTCNKILEEE